MESALGRQEEVEKFTRAYFTRFLGTVGEETIVCTNPTDERSIYLNKLAVLKFMHTIWGDVQTVKGVSVKFENLVGVIKTYYDMNYPYVSLWDCGKVFGVDTVGEFSRFANAIAHIVFVAGVFEPASSAAEKARSSAVVDDLAMAFSQQSIGAHESISAQISNRHDLDHYSMPREASQLEAARTFIRSERIGQNGTDACELDQVLRFLLLTTGADAYDFGRDKNKNNLCRTAVTIVEETDLGTPESKKGFEKLVGLLDKRLGIDAAAAVEHVIRVYHAQQYPLSIQYRTTSKNFKKTDTIVVTSKDMRVMAMDLKDIKQTYERVYFGDDAGKNIANETSQIIILPPEIDLSHVEYFLDDLEVYLEIKNSDTNVTEDIEEYSKLSNSATGLHAHGRDSVLYQVSASIKSEIIKAKGDKIVKHFDQRGSSRRPAQLQRAVDLTQARHWFAGFDKDTYLAGERERARTKHLKPITSELMSGAFAMFGMQLPAWAATSLSFVTSPALLHDIEVILGTDFPLDALAPGDFPDMSKKMAASFARLWQGAEIDIVGESDVVAHHLQVFADEISHDELQKDEQILEKIIQTVYYRACFLILVLLASIAFYAGDFKKCSALFAALLLFTRAQFVLMGSPVVLFLVLVQQAFKFRQRGQQESAIADGIVRDRSELVDVERRLWTENDRLEIKQLSDKKDKLDKEIKDNLGLLPAPLKEKTEQRMATVWYRKAQAIAAEVLRKDSRLMVIQHELSLAAAQTPLPINCQDLRAEKDNLQKEINDGLRLLPGSLAKETTEKISDTRQKYYNDHLRLEELAIGSPAGSPRATSGMWGSAARYNSGSGGAAAGQHSPRALPHGAEGGGAAEGQHSPRVSPLASVSSEAGEVPPPSPHGSIGEGASAGQGLGASVSGGAGAGPPSPYGQQNQPAAGPGGSEGSEQGYQQGSEQGSQQGSQQGGAPANTGTFSTGARAGRTSASSGAGARRHTASGSGAGTGSRIVPQGGAGVQAPRKKRRIANIAGEKRKQPPQNAEREASSRKSSHKKGRANNLLDVLYNA